VNLSSEQLHDLGVDLNNLSVRLIELDERITEDNYEARRSLTEAFRHFNRLARIFAPELVVVEDVAEAEDKEPDQSS
jgi:hypothetical protein